MTLLLDSTSATSNPRKFWATSDVDPFDFAGTDSLHAYSRIMRSSVIPKAFNSKIAWQAVSPSTLSIIIDLFGGRHPNADPMFEKNYLSAMDFSALLSGKQVFTTSPIDILDTNWFFESKFDSLNQTPRVEYYSNAVCQMDLQLVDAQETCSVQFENILRNLGRLKDGWAGADSVAPSERVVRDLEVVGPLLPVRTTLPEIEVDPDDGAVALRWMSTYMLSIIARGDRHITCVISGINDNDRGPWRLSIDDDAAITRLLHQDNILDTLSAQ